MAKQLALLCPFLASTPQGMEQIKDVLVQHGKQLLDDDHQEVRQLASEVLIVIAELLDGDDVGFVLAAVLQLAHDERDEAKVTAIGLMAQLAPLCGPELVQHYIAKEITSASDDPTSWQVRKVVAQSYGSVCQVVGPEVTVNQLVSFPSSSYPTRTHEPLPALLAALSPSSLLSNFACVCHLLDSFL